MKASLRLGLGRATEAQAPAARPGARRRCGPTGLGRDGGSLDGGVAQHGRDLAVGAPPLRGIEGR